MEKLDGEKKGNVSDPFGSSPFGSSGDDIVFGEDGDDAISGPYWREAA